MKASIPGNSFDGRIDKSPSVGCVARKEGRMSEKERLTELVQEMICGASEKEMRLVYIAVREILSK